MRLDGAKIITAFATSHNIGTLAGDARASSHSHRNDVIGSAVAIPEITTTPPTLEFFTTLPGEAIRTSPGRTTRPIDSTHLKRWDTIRGLAAPSPKQSL